MKKFLQFRFLLRTAMIITILMFVALWSGRTTETLYANGNCQGFHNYKAGTDLDFAVAVVATSIDLNSRQPLLCTGSNNVSASAVWTTIVANRQNTGYCGWAQAGYFIKPGLAVKVFGEYNKRSCTTFNEPDYKLVVWGTGQNGVHTYQVKYNANKHLARMWYGNKRITKTPFDPGAEWGSQPWGRRWSGETHDYGDDMPGSAPSPVYFTNLLYQNCQTCSWLDPGIPANYNSLPERYGLQQDTGSSFHIWTK